MAKTRQGRSRRSLQKSLLVLQALFLASIGFMPFILFGHAKAAQLTNRYLTVSSGQAGNTGVTYKFGFTPATAGVIQSIMFTACTTPLGDCTTPTTGIPAGLDMSAATGGTVTGFTDTTAFAPDSSGGGQCTPSAHVLCAKRTSSQSESAAGTISFGGITNPSNASCATQNCTFFVRITTYSDTGYSSTVDTGTVATSMTQLLTVNAQIQEILQFCIGSTTVDDVATTNPGSDCSAISGTSVNLGVLDTTVVNVTPADPVTQHGDGKNGIAMVRTNAVNGVTITYDAIQQSGTNHQGTLRVPGATCSASAGVITDQCINAQGNAQAAFTAGQERFGMTIAGVNMMSTSAYTGAYTAGTSNLKPTNGYQGDGTFGTSYVYGTTNGFAWDETGTPENIATSPTVVDDEALIIKFAATPSITTPTGSYTAQADFVATPVY